MKRCRKAQGVGVQGMKVQGSKVQGPRVGKVQEFLDSEEVFKEISIHSPSVTKQVFFVYYKEMADDGMAEIGRDGREVIRTDKHKGRGAKPEVEEEERYVGKSGMFDSLDDEPGAGPQKCALQTTVVISRNLSQIFVAPSSGRGLDSHCYRGARGSARRRRVGQVFRVR